MGMNFVVRVFLKSQAKRIPPNFKVVDLTSRAEMPWVKFSPFFPHGSIPVPVAGTTLYSESVEGAWQGLKVFEHESIDLKRLENRSMKNIKRSGIRRGRVLGHRIELSSDELIDYKSARERIYMPMYRWVLENKLTAEIDLLRTLCEAGAVALLDYNNCEDIGDLSKPLSHAVLVKQFLLRSEAANPQ